MRVNPNKAPKAQSSNGGNGFDQGFYAGLLHITGLDEVVAGGRTTVARKPDGQRNRGSLLENAIHRVDKPGMLERVHRLDRYGQNHDEQRFNIALELSITWISRVLFIKLLDARLPTPALLDRDRVRTFGDLERLFFEVLARHPDERTADAQRRFPDAPYLNGSLFEPTELERRTIAIGSLSDPDPLPVHRSVPGNESSRCLTGSLEPVGYLLDFLDAFDFSPNADARARQNDRRPIEASVISSVFERINGYRDGAFFTPAVVTTHMCRETIARATIRKFNRTKGWNCSTIDQLAEHIEDRDEANRIVDSLHICDPAVGSGHFLVAALNEIIALKGRLRILTDREGRPLTGYRVKVEANELVVNTEDGAPIALPPADGDSRLIDEMLFEEKRTIIEHCLFGVDLNPNAVRVCRLRLWVELLKHAYPDGNGRLDTLPNVDVNIRQGNAVVSRFGLDDELRPAPERRSVALANYRSAVAQHRHAATATERHRTARLIEEIKDGLCPRQPDRRRSLARSGQSDGIYDDAFEWRFEFPEILDGDGRFEGFDAVIANPPYIDSEKMFNDGRKRLRKHLTQTWPSAKGNWDLYIVFMELGLQLLNATGTMACITPDKWLSRPFGEAFRTRHLGRIDSLTTLGRGVFESAIVDSIVTLFSNDGAATVRTASIENGTVTPMHEIRKDALCAPYRLDLLRSPHYALIRRLDAAHPSLGSLLRCENACTTADAYRLKPLIHEARGTFSEVRHYRVVNTGTLGKFVSRWGARPMTYLGDRYQEPVVDRSLFAQAFPNRYSARAGSKKVIVKGLTQLDAALDLAGDTIPGKTTLVLRADDEALLKYVAAVLNCPVSLFCLDAKFGSSSYNGGIAFTKDMVDSLPVPAEPATRIAVVREVDELLRAKRAGREDEARAAGTRVNRLLYAGFGLSAQEIDVIEGRTSKPMENEPTPSFEVVEAG